MLGNSNLEPKDFLKISVMVSGGGTNFQAIIDGVEQNIIKFAKVVQVISSNPKAFALERAAKHKIKSVVIDKETYPDSVDRTAKIIETLKSAETDLVVLAGYMSILDAALIDEYSGRIINIHPSLIPKFCGKGFYGKKVHEAVIAAGETESGATVHFVDHGVDTGPILLQGKVAVEKNDTADTLAARVLEVEHKLLQEVLKHSAEQFYKTKMAEKESFKTETGGI